MSLLTFGFFKQKRPCDEPSISVEPELDTNLLQQQECHEMSQELLDSESESKFVNPSLDDDRSKVITEERDPSMFVEQHMLDAEIKRGPVAVDTMHIGRSGRGFRKEWIQNRPWLEYSKATEKAYCFPCRLFSRSLSAAQVRGHDAFITKGFCDWAHALGKGRGFTKHEISEVHQTCTEMLTNRQRQLLDSENNPCISSCISAAFRSRQLQREKETAENRRYIGTLSSVMRLLLRLGLATRGHREDEESLHRGNFRELVELLRQSDSFLDSQLSLRPGNAHYLSPTSQKALIEAIGGEVLSTILREALAADYYAVTMDETTDLSHLEQIAIVVRYCDSDFNPVERLVCLTESSTVTGQALASIMLRTLDRYGFDLDKLVAQTYDGAAAMSGQHRGVQAIVREKAPHAHYNHCRSHSSNLVVVKSAQSTPFGRNFFGILEQLYVMIEGSAKRHQWFLECQTANGLPPKSLKALSDTRWNCQGRSVDVVRTRLTAVNETLRKIRDESSDRKVVGEAVGLLSCTIKFEFALAIELFAKILSPLDTLTRALQGPDATLHTVTTLSRAACETLEQLRQNLDNVFSEAVVLAERNDIETEPAERRMRKVSRKIDSGCNELCLSAVDELKRQMLEVTDIALTELKSRFHGSAGRLYEMVGALMNNVISIDELRDHIDALYPAAVDVDVAVAQFDLVRHIPTWLTAKTLQLRALACPPSMIELRQLYKIMLTIPVTSAGCERTFSKLALIKNKLRTTCSQDRLESLLLCTVERDVVKRVDVERVIDRFAETNDTRIRLK
jgi:Domain of unknown function (DUF4371)/hAT family C-terminal dimerisation region